MIGNTATPTPQPSRETHSARTATSRGRGRRSTETRQETPRKTSNARPNPTASVLRRSQSLGLQRLCPLTVLLIFAVLLWSTTAMAHEDDGYSHDGSGFRNRAGWMAHLPDDARISDLSLPGTHDTMSFHGGDAVQTQSLSLQDQLNAGIRVLDIRARHSNDLFKIFHGSVYQHAVFGEDVLKPVIAFLRAHPRETVLIRLKEEYDPTENTRSFADTFLGYMNTFNSEAQDTYGRFVWRPDGSTNTALGQVRGKIVFMLQPSRFDASTLGAWGIPYDDGDLMSIQDDYHLTTNWDLYGKWERIRDHLHAADQGDRHRIYINYLSGSGGSFPYFVASGHSSPGTGAPRLATGLTTPGWDDSYPDFPRVDCFWLFLIWDDVCTIAFEGTNTLTKHHLRSSRAGRVGILMADFPGDGLIDAIIARNPIVSFISKSAFNGKCLDLDAASSNLQVWDCHGGDNQQWTYDNSTGVIRSLASEKCLDASGYYGNAYMAPCHFGLNQRWDLLPSGLIRDRAHHQCLDLYAFNNANGANVQMYECWEGDNQRWYNLTDLGTLSSGFNGKCLDVQGAMLRVQAWDCHDGINQKWVYNAASGYILAAGYSDRCLFAPLYNDDIYITQCDFAGGSYPELQWDLMPSGAIRNRGRDLCLDLFAFNDTNGANVVTWPCNGLANQRWRKST